ncbi:hypothetical protein ACN38_g4749 [Penicillium nordicum]|uniref:Uncharacterized protein n=1 Tax=Penicillium nordicum TaxID=229535 RepID=A0A0N0RZ41_9EURO|nr:hypothetical protein ACN38_g4749 [Penicillium nordicum]
MLVLVLCQVIIESPSCQLCTQPISKHLLQPAPGLASYKLGQKTTISEHYAQIDQAPIYIVHDMTASPPQRSTTPVVRLDRGEAEAWALRGNHTNSALAKDMVYR